MPLRVRQPQGVTAPLAALPGAHRLLPEALGGLLRSTGNPQQTGQKKKPLRHCCGAAWKYGQELPQYSAQDVRVMRPIRHWLILVRFPLSSSSLERPENHRRWWLGPESTGLRGFAFRVSPSRLRTEFPYRTEALIRTAPPPQASEFLALSRAVQSEVLMPLEGANASKQDRLIACIHFKPAHLGTHLESAQVIFHTATTRRLPAVLSLLH